MAYDGCPGAGRAAGARGPRLARAAGGRYVHAACLPEGIELVHDRVEVVERPPMRSVPPDVRSAASTRTSTGRCSDAGRRSSATPRATSRRWRSRALEACAPRGRRGRDQVRPAQGAGARGRAAHRASASYIYEMGCGLVDGDEEVFLTGGHPADGDVYRSRPDRALGRSAPAARALSGPARVRTSPWHRDREFSHLFRGNVDLAEAHRLLAEHGHGDLRLVDNGVTERRSRTSQVDAVHAYHLIPSAAGKGERGRRPHAAPRVRAGGRASRWATRARTSR